jgi:DNA-directed RNA polymerase subunit RPC12/RpoP
LRKYNMILEGLKMQCPNCGAEIVNNKCDYCDTKISKSLTTTSSGGLNLALKGLYYMHA